MPNRYPITLFHFLHSIRPYLQLHCSCFACILFFVSGSYTEQELCLSLEQTPLMPLTHPCYHRYPQLLTAGICDFLSEASSGTLAPCEACWRCWKVTEGWELVAEGEVFPHLLWGTVLKFAFCCPREAQSRTEPSYPYCLAYSLPLLTSSLPYQCLQGSLSPENYWYRIPISGSASWEEHNLRWSLSLYSWCLKEYIILHLW